MPPIWASFPFCSTGVVVVAPSNGPAGRPLQGGLKDPSLYRFVETTQIIGGRGVPRVGRGPMVQPWGRAGPLMPL
ncbi:MAG: hypothetical protein CM15mP55_1880 [Hyphomicrobiales bacterium]|nr:MAG: hypothetical protein CM15mP55_1880 [Hyphomicrobiales bacterium]